MKKCAPPTSPRRSEAAPPAVASGKATAGTLQFATDLPGRIRCLADLFDNREEAAVIAGRSRDAIQNWITGKSEPGFEAIARLALAKSVSLEWLATGLGDMRTGSDSLLSTYSELPLDVRKRLDQAIELVANAHQQRETDIECVLRLTLGAP